MTTYKQEKMAEALNMALGAIFQRHQPPVSDCVSLLSSALISIINQTVAIEEREELVNALCGGIKYNVQIK